MCINAVVGLKPYALHRNAATATTERLRPAWQCTNTRWCFFTRSVIEATTSRRSASVLPRPSSMGWTAIARTPKLFGEIPRKVSVSPTIALIRPCRRNSRLLAAAKLPTATTSFTNVMVRVTSPLSSSKCCVDNASPPSFLLEPIDPLMLCKPSLKTRQFEYLSVKSRCY